MTEKSRETATENDVIDTYKQNALRTIDEMSKYQPQYAQSISNLQQEYLQATKDTINRSFAIQKSWYASTRNPFAPATGPYAAYAEQFKKQSDEVTAQAFHVFDTANKLAIESLNTASQNVQLYSKTFVTMNEYNENLANTWSNYFTSAQKQYSK